MLLEAVFEKYGRFGKDLSFVFSCKELIVIELTDNFSVLIYHVL